MTKIVGVIDSESLMKLEVLYATESTCRRCVHCLTVSEGVAYRCVRIGGSYVLAKPEHRTQCHH